MDNSRKNAEGYNDPTAYKAIMSTENGVANMRYNRGDVFECDTRSGLETKIAIIISSEERCNDRYLSIVMLSDKAYGDNAVEILAHSKMYADCNRVSFAEESRLGEYIRSATDYEMAELDAALMASLGLGAHEDTKIADDLRMKLEGAEREIDDLNIDLQKCRDALRNKDDVIVRMEAEKNMMLPAKNTTDDTIRLTAERDLYKAQYEMLLEKLIAR